MALYEITKAFGLFVLGIKNKNTEKPSVKKLQTYFCCFITTGREVEKDLGKNNNVLNFSRINISTNLAKPTTTTTNNKTKQYNTKQPTKSSEKYIKIYKSIPVSG